jgi:hypothetical protein
MTAMVEVTKEDANNYCRVLAALGLEEEGDPVAAIERLKAEAVKSERRAITFGDIVAQQVMAMRAAVVDAILNGPDAGMAWIEKTLEGPGHLPDLKAARAEGGAQCMFNREMSEHEAFRAAHPAP